MRVLPGASTDGGYATIAVIDGTGSTVASSVVDFYSKYRDTAHELKYVSPRLPPGSYTLTLTVLGQHSSWSDKAGTQYGSTGNYVSVDRVVVSAI